MITSITTNVMVESVDETVQFYQEVLGSTIIDSVSKDGVMDFAIIETNGILLMFQRKGSLVEEYPTMDTKHIKATFTLFIQVEQIETYVQQLSSKAIIVKDLNTTFYGMKEFAIKDNNGCILTIAEKVK